MFKKIVAVISLIFLISYGINAEEIILDKAVNPDIKPIIQENIPTENYKIVSPLDLVNTPQKYLNKQVKFRAKFDKFSTLGLDYPPVKKDAKTYISFLIKRENVTTYNIPLSELKLIIKRDYAEKEMVNIEQGDEIEIYGNVFSTALGDPWVNVEKIIILTPHKNKEVKEVDKK